MVFQGFREGLRDELAAQKDRLFLWIPVAFGIGVIAYFLLPGEPGWWPALIIMAMAAPGVVFGYRKQHKDVPHFMLFVASLCLLVAGAGFELSQYATHRDGTVILDKGLRYATLIGTVDSVEDLGGKGGSRVVLSDLAIEKLAPDDTPRRIRLRFQKDEGLEAGQKISTLVKIDPTSPPVLPGSYDFQRHLFFQGIGAVGFSYKVATIVEEEAKSAFILFFERLRRGISHSVDEQSGRATAGIMTALITGQRGAIAEEDDEAMRGSGLYHLLSISGTHVSMVAAVLFFFSRLLMAAIPWVALHWPIKKIAAVIALCGAIFYTLLAGADVPAQRAALMTGLVLIAIMLDRSPFSLRLIAFAALVVMAVAPYSLVGVSFQMSFAAVAALICFFDYIQPVWTRLYSRSGFLRKGLLYLIGIILTSLIAGGMTGLFSLYHFQQFSVYGVLANMIAVPLTGLIIMPAAIVSLILMPVGLEGWALDIMEWGTVWMLAVAHWTAGLEGAVIHVSQWPVQTFAFMSAGIVLFLLWSGWRGKGIAVCLILFGLGLTLFNPKPTILVSDGGELFGVRDKEGRLFLSSGRKDKFVAENWMRMFGKEGERYLTFRDEEFPFLCDDHGCRSVLHEMKVSLAFDTMGWREDCAWADILIAQVPVRDKDCPYPKFVLDLMDFKKNGAYAVYINRYGVRYESVADTRRGRPWVK